MKRPGLLSNGPLFPRMQSSDGRRRPASLVMAILVVLVLAIWPAAEGPAWSAGPAAAPTVIVLDATPSTGEAAGEPQPQTADEGKFKMTAWSLDGGMMAVGTTRAVYLYDSSTLEAIRSLEVNLPVTAISFAPSGVLMSVGTWDGEVQAWRVSDGRLIRRLKAHEGSVDALAFSPNGVSLASGGWDGRVQFFRVNDGRLIRTLVGHLGAISDLEFSPDGALLASAAADGSVRLWQSRDGKALRVLQGTGGAITRLQFSPDGQMLATGAADGGVRLWRVADGSLLNTLEGHEGWITGLVFWTNGGVLASSSIDGTVRIWQTSSGQPLDVLDGASGPIGQIALMPDDITLMTTNSAGAVKIWNDLPYQSDAPDLVIAEPTPTAPKPVGCTTQLAFVADVTFPDNSVVNPGDQIDKIWRVKNTGTCTWGQGYRLAFVSGEQLGAPGTQAVLSTPPGGVVDVSVPMYAPGAPGVYSALWQMQDPKGKGFGPRVTVVIQVLGPQPPTVTPQPPIVSPPPPPGSNLSISADQTNINAGQCTKIRASVEGVAAAWLDGEAIVGGYREKDVCPCGETTYTLDAQMTNGQHEYRTVVVQVSGTCAPAGKPDLRVRDLDVNHETGLLGSTLEFKMRIKNDGSTPANHFNAAWRPYDGADWIVVGNDLSLNPGQDQWLNWDYKYNSVGEYTSRGMVDYSSGVDEGDEGNNQKTRTVKIIKLLIKPGMTLILPQP